MLKLQLPSGKTFYFTYECILQSDTDKIEITKYALNTAIESGWYTATLYSTLYNEDSNFMCLKDSIIFNPPKGIDPGDPEAIFVIY